MYPKVIPRVLMPKYWKNFLMIRSAYQTHLSNGIWMEKPLI
jgi:hypothetical protein